MAFLILHMPKGPAESLALDRQELVDAMSPDDCECTAPFLSLTSKMLDCVKNNEYLLLWATQI